jgi:DHA2 family multidrug resistance protein
LINLLQQGIGGTVGLATMTTLLQRRTTYHTSLLAESQVSSALPWGEVLGPAHDLMARAGEVGTMAELKSLALLHRHLEQQATVAAYQDCFMLVVFMCLVAMPLVLFLRQHTSR